MRPCRSRCWRRTLSNGVLNSVRMVFENSRKRWAELVKRTYSDSLNTNRIEKGSSFFLEMSCFNPFSKLASACNSVDSPPSALLAWISTSPQPALGHINGLGLHFSTGKATMVPHLQMISAVQMSDGSKLVRLPIVICSSIYGFDHGHRA